MQVASVSGTTGLLGGLIANNQQVLVISEYLSNLGAVGLLHYVYEN